MRVLVLADVHGVHWEGGSGRADIVLACGDVADRVILEAAEAWQCATIFAVKGNHDSSGSFPRPIRDLHLRVREHGG